MRYVWSSQPPSLAPLNATGECKTSETEKRSHVKDAVSLSIFIDTDMLLYSIYCVVAAIYQPETGKIRPSLELQEPCSFPVFGLASLVPNILV